MNIKINLDFMYQMRVKEPVLSIKTVATALGYKTPTGYWLIENGERKASAAVLYKLSKLYGCTMEDFMLAEEV